MGIDHPRAEHLDRMKHGGDPDRCLKRVHEEEKSPVGRPVFKTGRRRQTSLASSTPASSAIALRACRAWIGFRSDKPVPVRNARSVMKRFGSWNRFHEEDAVDFRYLSGSRRGLMPVSRRNRFAVQSVSHAPKKSREKLVRPNHPLESIMTHRRGLHFSLLFGLPTDEEDEAFGSLFPMNILDVNHSCW